MLCLASIEKELPAWRKESGLGWVTAEYAMLPRATHSRSSRESIKGKPSSRSLEISRLIGRSLRSIVDFKKLGPHIIALDCEVLQADGGTRCASITGAWVALAQACQKLLKSGAIQEWPLKDHVAAVSVGILHKNLLLDLDYEEDSRAEVDLNLILTGSGKIVEIQGTAEQNPFSFRQATQLFKLGELGIKKLIQEQNKVMRLK